MAALPDSGDRELYRRAVRAAIGTITDAAWWIANEKAHVRAVKWPRAWERSETDQPEDRALVRVCDTCSAVTAFDLDASDENRLRMDRVGQTVRDVSKSECLRLWKTASKCRCAEVKLKQGSGPGHLTIVGS